MKKLLGYLSMAAMVAGTFVLGSCQADGPEEEISFYAQKHSSEVNVEIGGIRGFEMATRGVDVNGNMWGNLDEILPYPTAEEKAGVMAYIAANPGANVAWPGYRYYYVQDVVGAHHTYTYKDFNNTSHSMDGTQSLEHLQILEVPEFDGSGWQHVYNFNAGKCENGATHNAVLMTSGFQAAKTLDEYGSSTVTQWKLYYWQGNYYLAFDFSTHKGDGSVEPDGIYDDWIMKIIPGKGETPKSPDVDPSDDPQDDPQNPDVDPDKDPLRAEVEVDIHHQDHKDWNEIKTSVHLRDTVNVRIFIPVEKQYQAVPDDFDIRAGEDYTYLSQDVKEMITVNYTIASKPYQVQVQVSHLATGIEIILNGADCAEALKDARGIYDDGITFEIHSYLIPGLSASTIWNDILKNVAVPQTSKSGTPATGQCVTYTHGQIHSAYYEEQQMKFAKDPEK